MALSNNFLSRLYKKGTETQDRQAGRQTGWQTGRVADRQGGSMGQGDTGTQEQNRTDKLIKRKGKTGTEIQNS